MTAADPAAATSDLDTPYALSEEQVARYRRDGFIKLKEVLSPTTLARYGAEITAQVQALNRLQKPMAERTTYQRAFLQVMNVWQNSALVREFVWSRRLAGIAATLMGTRGARLYHDQALYKEAGGGHTPWHADQYYWPLASDKSITVWIPLQAVPSAMGPLAFAAGSHRVAFGRDLEISDESEAALGRTLKDFPIEESPFALGEVSFHAGWTFHRAGSNRSEAPRAVMTMIYLDSEMRLAAPKNTNQKNDWATWMPGARIGELVDTRLNPLLYGA